MKQNILLVIALALILSGCGVYGSIDVNTTTRYDPQGNVTEVLETCDGSYWNGTFGSAGERTVNGCEAKGGAKDVDTVGGLKLLLDLLKAAGG